MRKRYTPEERERIVAEVRAGTSANEVAARKGVSPSMVYRWVQAAAERSAPEFVRVIPTREVPSSTVTIEVAGAMVRVQAGFDVGLLRAVVAALGGNAK